MSDSPPGAPRSLPAALPMPDLRDSFPGPFPISPHADAIERHADDWLTTYPLIGSPGARAALCNITSQGIARTLPTADIGSLFLCADLFLWLTAFDDTCGETAGADDLAELVRRSGEFIELLAGHHDERSAVEPSVFGASLRDLLARFEERATPTQYLRITAHLRDNFFGILWEAHHLHAPDQVTVRDYRAMRPHTVFVRTVMAAAEVALGYELTPQQRSSTAVREVESAVGNLAGWINDVASYAKEAAHGGPGPLSLPTLLMHQYDCDIESAFRRAARMCEEEAVILRSRLTELTAGSAGELADHAGALESIAASYVWHIGHSRYRP
ncbi:terpene synthase family protein [Streptomyces sp. NPDC060035]|uniref:terpene synthase family protein n=1 Tax=Streptomyces sp. NPDC060035 TaxID=3347044 RepID=UPI0036916117